MAPTIDTVPRPEWSALPHEGARGVEGKVLLREEKLLLALLRFGRDATIHEHAGESEAIVVCLEGDGYTSVENESARLQAHGTVCGRKARRCSR